MRIPALLTTALLATLLGCGTGVTVPTSGSNTPLNLSGNWQIQSAAVQTTGSAALLLGSLTSSGTQVTGRFQYSDLVNGSFCGALNQLVTATGTLDTSQSLTQSVTLTGTLASGGVVTAQLVFPTVLAGTTTGTLQVTGSTCAVPSSQAIGIEYQPATGTYTGALTPSSNVTGNSAVPGTGTLTLTQSSTPSADGSFPTTGSLTLVAGTCTQTTALTGMVDGPILSLSALPSGTSLNVVTLSAVNPPLLPTPTQLPSVNLLYFPAPCSVLPTSGATYNGTLTKK